MATTKTKNSAPVFRDDIKEIPLEKLIPRENNANHMNADQMALLKKNISAQQGLTEAVIVCPHPKKKGYYEILDGHQRVKAFKDLDLDEILCDIWDIASEEDKIVLELTLNDLQGTTNQTKRNKILSEAAAKLSEDSFLGRIPGAMITKSTAKETTPTAAPPKKSTAVHSAVPAPPPNKAVTQFSYPAKWQPRVEKMLEKGSYLLEEDDYDKIPQTLNGKSVTPKTRQFLAIVQFTEVSLNFGKPETEPKKKPAKKKSNGSKPKTNGQKKKGKKGKK